MIFVRIASILFLATATLFLTPETAIAVEIDDITGYYTPLKDANEVLNAQIEKTFQKAIEDTKSCDTKELITNTKALLRPKGLIAKIFGGGLEEFAIGSKDIEKYKPELDTSVYRDTPYSRSYIANGAQIIRIATVYPSIRLNGQIMGVDKLSHFFETGMELFQEHLNPEILAKNGRETQIAALVAHAIELEETNLGWTITGIKSYGDIHAHLQGAFFWAQYFKQNGQWLSCENNKFKLKKKFDLGQYAQVGWSEAVQCNEYVPKAEQTYLEKFFNKNSKSFEEEVLVNIEALEKKYSRRYHCPIDPAACGQSLNYLKKTLPFLTPEQVRAVTSPACREME